MVSVDEAISHSEIWKNTTRGICAVKVLDNLGREQDKVIRGGQTFQISTRERQMNQWAAANGDLDMFRNGRLAMISPSSSTNMSEVASPDSWTDSEIEDFILQRIGDEKSGGSGKEPLEKVITEMKSAVTLIRFKEEAALQKLPAKLRKVIDNKIDEVNVEDGRVEVVEREVVTSPKVVMTKAPEDEKSTPKVVKAKGEAVKGG